MYLISLYFDEQTEEILEKHMKKVAVETGNSYMREKSIPPHLTIAASKELDEQRFIELVDLQKDKWHQGMVEWVSVGAFMPHVLFLTPVLNEYLHELCVLFNQMFEQTGEEKMANTYQPFHWIPHTTVARKLSDEQMRKGFQVLQANFQPFSGMVTEIGLAKSNPYQDIKRWHLDV